MKHNPNKLAFAVDFGRTKEFFLYRNCTTLGTVKQHLTFLFAWFCTSLLAQEVSVGKWAVEGNYQVCSFIKHSSKINSVPKSVSHALELNVSQKTFGEKPWHKGLNFPEIGFAFNYYHFGDNTIFGDAYAITPFVKFYLFRSKVANAYARLGYGFGFLTKHYDYLNNPSNNIVGSAVNMAFSFRLGLEWKVSKHVLLNTAFTFTHFSNGSAKLPNYGINLAVATVGIKVYPHIRSYTYNCAKIRPKKRDEIILRYGLGIHQKNGFNGPTYFAHVASIAYARYTGVANKVYAGVAFEYIPSITDFLYSNDLMSKREAKRNAFITSLFWGDEILIGRVGCFVGLGVYIPPSKLMTKPVYFKTGCNYYLAEFGKRKGFKCFVGMNVKSHTSVAQYWEVATGMCF